MPPLKINVYNIIKVKIYQRKLFTKKNRIKCYTKVKEGDILKYKKIVQKPYCCVGSCIEMILNRNKISNQGQIDIACNLGLIVPQEYSKIYPNAIIGEKPDAGFGTQIQKEE